MTGAVAALRLHGIAPNRTRRRKLTSRDTGHINTERVVACAYAVCVGAVALGEVSRRTTPGMIPSMPSTRWAPAPSPRTRGGAPPRAVAAVGRIAAHPTSSLAERRTCTSGTLVPYTRADIIFILNI